MLGLGGWVPGALSHSWAGAPLGQEQWMPAHFPFAQLRVVFAQRPSGSKFTFCLFLFTEDQSLPPGSHGQSTLGTQVEPVPSPGEAVPPAVDMHSLPVPLPHRGTLSLCPKAMDF